MEKQNAMEMMKCVVILVVYEMVMSYGWFHPFSHNHGSGEFFAVLMKGNAYWRHTIFYYDYGRVHLKIDVSKIQRQMGA